MCMLPFFTYPIGKYQEIDIPSSEEGFGWIFPNTAGGRVGIWMHVIQSGNTPRRQGVR